MRIYIASKTVHAPRWIALRKLGVHVTSSWIDEWEEGQTEGYDELATRCIDDVRSSDAVLLYCEAGEILKGAIIEAGAALALGIPVLCVGDCPSLSRVFRKHPIWSDHETLGDALAALKANQEGRR